MSKEEKDKMTSSDDFRAMVGLLEDYSRTSAKLANLQTALNAEYLELVEHFKNDYAELQCRLGSLEANLELAARTHKEWFGDRKSIRTPFGTVKFHASTSLEIPNEEASIILIEQHENENEEFDSALYLKAEIKVNREALEELDDSLLKQFRVKRIPKNNFSVVPAIVDLGKAVKEAHEAASKQAA